MFDENDEIFSEKSGNSGKFCFSLLKTMEIYNEETKTVADKLKEATQTSCKMFKKNYKIFDISMNFHCPILREYYESCKANKKHVDNMYKRSRFLKNFFNDGEANILDKNYEKFKETIFMYSTFTPCSSCMHQLLLISNKKKVTIIVFGERLYTKRGIDEFLSTIAFEWPCLNPKVFVFYGEGILSLFESETTDEQSTFYFTLHFQQE